jgi:hypothetical protein
LDFAHAIPGTFQIGFPLFYNARSVLPVDRRTSMRVQQLPGRLSIPLLLTKRGQLALEFFSHDVWVCFSLSRSHYLSEEPVS